MSRFNKSYRIRTEVGKDTQLYINLDRKYKTLEIMSLKINQENAYKLHTSNYGVIAGRVLANEAFGIPNAKISVFINIDNNDIYDPIKSVLYPYNTTYSKNKDGIRYNLLPNEQINNCHTIIGTFTEKQYTLDNDSTLEIFDKYYKYTTRTNNAGDYMIFGVPIGSQTIHVDIDLSDIGILSQKPRDMVYKGYNIEQFENPNKFKYDTNLESLTQVISQDNVTEVIPFWGDESENSIGITRCDINVQYKFEPTCVFMGSVVSDTFSNGISKKCIPTPGMGSMEEITTGSGTIEMIRKTPSGDVEEFQIKGTQLINGDGVWCYQIPMNLDYMMTDEYGNIVPTNDPKKGIPTRTRVRFRISMQDFDSDSINMFRCKMLVPHNPDIYSDKCETDYQFGTYTKDESYRDLYWNGVYSVKSYIPRIQKGANWKNEKFTGFKRVNYYGDKNPIPYNNIRIRIPFIYSMLCLLIKLIIGIVSIINWVFNLLASSLVNISILVNGNSNDSSDDDDDNDNEKIKGSGSLISLSGEMCNENLDNLCIIPGINIENIVNKNNKSRKTLLGFAIIKFFENLGGDLKAINNEEIINNSKTNQDIQSIDYKNKNKKENNIKANSSNSKKDNKVNFEIEGVKVTDDITYFIECIEMNLAQEFKVIQFDFYNDWINGLIYIPRWMRTITKKKSFFWGLVKWGGKVKACNENYKRGKRNIVQQCGLSYDLNTNKIVTSIGCKDNSDNLLCHKSTNVRLKYPILNNDGIVYSVQTLKSQYVYYFKPFESHENKNVRLFATDIILLGTLNECDIWGIPNNFNDLFSSTYQMPPNLALTDSDLEGNDYETNTNDDVIELTINTNKMKVTNIGFNVNKLKQITEVGNYTEISGINWGYEGPLQSYTIKDNINRFNNRNRILTVDNIDNTDIKNDTDNIKENIGDNNNWIDNNNRPITPSNPDTNSNPYKNFYKPGGHFLGLTCRNSETTIKSCVNLSRICEHGVWMSQRQDLNIPNKDLEGEFLDYATIPTGLISKDEISDTNYRTLFATMNNNKLKTKINKKTGYPIYDFIYINPTNFNGELNDFVKSDSIGYNNKVTSVVKEKNFEFIDDEYLIIEGVDGKSFNDLSEEYKQLVLNRLPSINEVQIRRTGEYLDEEYYKFRYGLTPLNINNENEKYKRFLINDTSNKIVSFPMYDNSFYFYFGLHDGKTALDEFKKTYYAVCDKNNKVVQNKNKQNDNLIQEDNNILIKNLKINYDGICDDIGSGQVFFNISANDNLFKDEGIEVILKNEIGDIISIKNINEINKDETIFWSSLNEGEYEIKVSSIKNRNINNIININIEKIKLNSVINGVNFKRDVSNYPPGYLFTIGEEKHNRVEYGGYIYFKNNIFEYKNSISNVIKENVYDSLYVRQILIKDKITNKIVLYNNKNGIEPYNFYYVDEKGISYIYNDIDRTYNDEYIIPVPESNKVYSVYISTFINECKPSINRDNIVNTYEWYIGDIEIKNGGVFDFEYNNISYKNVISKYITNNENSLSYEGWWNNDMILEDEYIQWKIKENLFHNSLITPHKINIKNIGGEAPYSEVITGLKNDLIDNNITRFDIENVNIPTINFLKNNQRRDNFTYQVFDKYGQKMPDLPFIIPTIYKPFFMELGLWYLNGYNKYFLYGNVYNGITWDYKTIGFNDVKLNNISINNFVEIQNNDLTMVIDEPSLTNDIGGYDYTGPYFKYNGRKVNVLQEINPMIYNINNFGIINNFNLSIGSSNIYNSNVYSDKTSIDLQNIELIKFDVEYKIFNERKYIKIKSNNISSKLYPIFNSETNGYIYPYDNNKLNISDKLFRDIMEDNINICDINFYKIEGIDGYIDIEEYQNLNKEIFYIAISDGIVNNTSNEENKLKMISISEKINIDTNNIF